MADSTSEDGDQPQEQCDADGSCLQLPSECETADLAAALREVGASLHRWSSEGPPSRMREKAGEYAARLHSVCPAASIGVAALRSHADDHERQMKSLQAAWAEASEKHQMDLADAEGRVEAAQAGEAKVRESWSELKEQAIARSSDLDELKAVCSVKLQREAKLIAQIASTLSPVSVMCRIRPLGSYGQAAGAVDRGGRGSGALTIDGGELTIEDNGGRPRKFRVDRVLGVSSTQDDVFSASLPWIENVVLGGNACVLAYGATGSGKTHTLQGCPTTASCKLGVAHYAVRRLVDECRVRRVAAVAVDGSGGTSSCTTEEESNLSMSVQVSMVEVYCDQIRDLLGERDATGTARAVSFSHRDGRSQVDCVEVAVRDFDTAQEVLGRGYTNRAATATLCNQQSSRSHVVITARLCQGDQPRGRLTLVDLAGSENVQRSGADAGGKLLDEAKAINVSLSALADVVEATAKRASHVPFRNSRLTTLLQEPLTTGKILLLVHVSPLARDTTNTVHSLQFAGRIQATDFGAQQLRKDQEDRLRQEARRAKEDSNRMAAQIDALKKEYAAEAAEKKEMKQQVAQQAEQMRALQRELNREQELRVRAEERERRSGLATSGSAGSLNSSTGGPDSQRETSQPSRGAMRASGNADLRATATSARSRSPHVAQGPKRVTATPVGAARVGRSPAPPEEQQLVRRQQSVDLSAANANLTAPPDEGVIVTERAGKKTVDTSVRGPRVPLGELTNNCREDDKQVLYRFASPLGPLGGGLGSPGGSSKLKLQEDAAGCTGGSPLPCSEDSGEGRSIGDGESGGIQTFPFNGAGSGGSPARPTQTGQNFSLRTSPSRGRTGSASPPPCSTPRSPQTGLHGSAAATSRSPHRASPVAARSPTSVSVVCTTPRSPGAAPQPDTVGDSIRFNLYDGVKVRSAIRRQVSADLFQRRYQRAEMAYSGKAPQTPSRQVDFKEETPVPKTPPQWYQELMEQRHLELLTANAIAAENAVAAAEEVFAQRCERENLPSPAPPRSWIPYRPQHASVPATASARLRSPPPEGLSSAAQLHYRSTATPVRKTIRATCGLTVGELPRWT